MSTSQVMKKLVSPFIHLLFLIPMMIVAMGSIEFIASSYNLTPDYIKVFSGAFLFLILAIISISGMLLFWIANRIVSNIENSGRQTVIDHFRQSVFYYFIIFYSIFTWIISGFSGNEDDVYFLTGLSISVVFIVVNVIFWTQKR